MNPSDDQPIENLLRRAPQPVPPKDLKEKLIMQMESNSTQTAVRLPTANLAHWVRRWWPMLVPAGFCLACAVVFAVQQNQLRELRQNIRTLSAQAASAQSASALPPAPAADDNLTSLQPDAKAADIAKLKKQVSQLTTEISKLEQFGTENQKLRTQLAAPRSGLTPEETASLEEAKARAAKIQCVNQLKQIGLAARIWAGDNNDVAPPDFLSMSNELSTPKILVCPADSGHQVAASFFTGFSSANYSYEYLAAGSTNFDTEPTRVMCRCPIHGTVLLCDGSVQMISTNQADKFIQQDGKLYFAPSPPVGR